MNNIKSNLSIATCTLLGGTAQQANAIENSWDLDSSLLYYSEDDDRVSVTKAMAFLTGDLSSDDTVNVNLVLDTMSGATPTGAVRSKNSSVSFSSASGAGSSTVDGGSVDRVNFSDTRLGIALSWAHSQDRLTTLTYGGSLSVEKDYQSYGASINYSLDSEDRLTTYTAGFAGSFDEIYRKTDGTPEPLSFVDDNNMFSNGERYSYDFILGVSKVLNRKTIGQLNYTISYSDGYHTDPYKVISEASLVEDTDTGEFAWAELNRYYEARPDNRLRHVIFTSMAHQYGDTGETVHASYRFYTDDWGISSNTIDLTHRTPLSAKSYIEPHFRYYQQSAADFFLHSFVNEDVSTPIILPEFASSDYRLDEGLGITTGIEYGTKLSGGNFRARIEFINWQYEEAEYDETKALVLQVSYQKLFD
ncbi:MAG: DUF3570 domain-containing protein [Gammaproteobacteria bacterium]|nr:DUF3570 domain-containing protein [Gammaproteobacteria bacterium]